MRDREPMRDRKIMRDRELMRIERTDTVVIAWEVKVCG